MSDINLKIFFYITHTQVDGDVKKCVFYGILRAYDNF